MKKKRPIQSQQYQAIEIERNREPFFPKTKDAFLQAKLTDNLITQDSILKDPPINLTLYDLLNDEPNKSELLQYHPDELTRKIENPIFMTPMDNEKPVLLFAIKKVRQLASSTYAKRYEKVMMKRFPKYAEEVIQEMNKKQWGKTYKFGKGKPRVWRGLTYENYKARIGHTNPESKKLAPELKAASDWGGKKVSPVTLSLQELNQILLPENSERKEEHKARMQAFLPYINNAFETMGIDTVKTQALYFAHSAGETSSYSILEEEPNDYTESYAPYVGRGPFQTTYRRNYVRVIAYLEKRAEQLEEQTISKMEEYKYYKNIPDTSGINLGTAMLALAEARTTRKRADKVREAMLAIKGDFRQAANPKYSFIFGAAHMHMSRMTNPSPKLGDTGTFKAGTPEVRGVTDDNQGGSVLESRRTFKVNTYARAIQVLKKKVVTK